MFIHPAVCETDELSPLIIVCHHVIENRHDGNLTTNCTTLDLDIGTVAYIKVPEKSRIMVHRIRQLVCTSDEPWPFDKLLDSTIGFATPTLYITPDTFSAKIQLG